MFNDLYRRQSSTSFRVILLAGLNRQPGGATIFQLAFSDFFGICFVT
jgi:hypothetical protein